MCVVQLSLLVKVSSGGSGEVVSNPLYRAPQRRKAIAMHTSRQPRPKPSLEADAHDRHGVRQHRDAGHGLHLLLVLLVHLIRELQDDLAVKLHLRVHKDRYVFVSRLGIQLKVDVDLRVWAEGKAHDCDVTRAQNRQAQKCNAVAICIVLFQIHHCSHHPRQRGGGLKR